MTLPRFTTADDLPADTTEGELAWMLDAACAGADLDQFFTSPTPDKVIARFCRRCPVRRDCLRFAPELRSRSGPSVA